MDCTLGKLLELGAMQLLASFRIPLGSERNSLVLLSRLLEGSGWLIKIIRQISYPGFKSFVPVSLPFIAL